MTTSTLATQGLPLGMFEDTEFNCDSYSIPTGGQLLLYSDGAFEPPLPEGTASPHCNR